MKPLIIALTGAAGCGKDTIANRLMETGVWGRYAFATPLKRGLATMFNIPIEDFESPTIKNVPYYKFGRSLRYMAQTLGTEFGRHLIADDVWIQLAKENIHNQLTHVSNIVITDCRFENEADMVHEMGGYVIKIIRDDNPHTATLAANAISNHASELGFPVEKCDFVLYNNGSLNAFEETSTSTIKEILLKHYNTKDNQ